MVSSRAAVTWAVYLTAAVALAEWDVSEWLAEEGRKDAAASEQADCWCKDIEAVVSPRLSTAGEELQQLSRTKESHHYENQRLRLEVNKHQQEASSHSRSLGEHQSITDRKNTHSEEDVQELQDSLHNIRKAIDTLPEGSSGGEVHNTLRSLEDKFADNLEEAQSSAANRQEQANGLQEAKQEMMRLARDAAATKQQRLARGLAVVAQAERQLDVFGKQQEADGSLLTAISDLCASLGSQATERQNKRQAATVLAAQLKADQAQNAAMRSAIGHLALLRQHAPNRSTPLHTSVIGGHTALRGAAALGDTHQAVAATPANRSRMAAIAQVRHTQRGDCSVRRDQAEAAAGKANAVLASAEKAARELMASVAKSDSVEGGLKAMLHGQMAGAHLAMGKLSDSGLKASVDGLFSMVQGQMASLEAPFGAVQAAGRTSSLADSRLVLELRSAAADAEVAAVAAKNC